MISSFDKTFRSIWLWSLGFFILAAFTGFLFRLGMLMPLPFELVNIRHAHSHLMFFNWITPIPMAFIARHLVKHAPESATSFRNCIYTTMAFGFAAYPFFLMYGYRPVGFGDTSLPLSVILSGVVMICWYWFMIIYLKNRKKTKIELPSVFYDAALVMLGISSLGAWGIAVFQFSGVHNPMFSTALTHFFLTTFTEGWCILAALGIIVDVSGLESLPVPATWLTAPVLLGVPLMFPFGMSAGLITDALLISARTGALLVAAGLSLNFYVLFRNSGKNIWVIVLVLLGLKIITQFGAAILPSSLWIGEHGLRIFYLHLLLLGFASLAFFTGFHQLLKNNTYTSLYILYMAVVLLLLSLLMLSGYWPASLLPDNLMVFITSIAILPVLAAIVEWISIYKNFSSLNKQV
ncbi:MAG: hypothetical protein WD604_10610 [Balneolaceae bacterium]